MALVVADPDAAEALLGGETVFRLGRVEAASGPARVRFAAMPDFA